MVSRQGGASIAPDPGGMDHQPSEIPGDALVRLASRWAEGLGATGWSSTGPGKRGDGAAGIEADLGLLRDAIPAPEVWVLNEPGSREPMFYSVGRAGPPLDLFSDRAPLLEAVRQGRGPHWEGDLALIRIPGPRSPSRRERRVLCVRLAAGQASDDRLRQRMELAAGLLGCLFQIRGSAAGRKDDRERLRESVREVHRLNVLLARNKGQMETAVITQRLIAVERREAEEAERFARGERPHLTARAPGMQDILRRVARVAASDIPVLILGESGVGKDLLARAIHLQSPRAKGPFVSEVCAIPESLLESELFGFVRGAFTGAHEDRPGLLQLCHGGTLYLDEISEMSGALQSRLARVLAERMARPIGAEVTAPIDLRLVSSSRRSLKELEESGDLRREFFYLIRGEVMEVPPLRERREDIPILVEEFIRLLAMEKGVPPPPVEPELISHLSRLNWPGNVRQLENEVRRAFLLHPDRLTREAFQSGRRSPDPGGPAASTPPSPARPVIPLRDARDAFERDLVIDALEAHGGNASQAARALKITRRYLGILLDKHGIRLADFGS